MSVYTARGVPCPACHAPDGEPCRRANGRTTDAHAARHALRVELTRPGAPIRCPRCGTPVPRRDLAEHLADHRATVTL